jgi:hypothetical protein
MSNLKKYRKIPVEKYYVIERTKLVRYNWKSWMGESTTVIRRSIV